jgi:hypothetical protein
MEKAVNGESVAGGQATSWERVEESQLKARSCPCNQLSLVFVLQRATSVVIIVE